MRLTWCVGIAGFARRHDLKRHELLHTGEKKYICEACKTPFVRLDALQRHHKSEVGTGLMVKIASSACNRLADSPVRSVLQNGAACVTIITEMAASGGLDIDQLAHMDMVDLVRARGVEL